MKSLFTYIMLLSATMFAACAGDNDFSGNNDGDAIPMDMASRVSTQDFENGGGDTEAYPVAKSSLYYQYASKTMKFDWSTSDVFTVFAVDPETNEDKTECYKFDVDTEQESISNGTKTTVIIKPEGDKTFPRKKNFPYVSFMPYIEQNVTNGNFGYDAIPVSYIGQTQTANMKIKQYYAKTNSANMEAYIQSEKDAAAHLSEYDYMCSKVTSTAGGHVQFDFNRMGSVIRFWMKAPAAEIYDSIQVVNTKSMFTLKTTMDAEHSTFSVAPIKKHYVQTLNLSGEGFDFRNASSDYYYKEVGYIVAYMMLAPIDLRSEDTYIYLCGHTDPEDPVGSKVYYKAGPMTKLNFEANKNYQWTVKPDPDEPIEFQAISVEDWKEGTTFTNGEYGSGTGSW